MPQMPSLENQKQIVLSLAQFQDGMLKAAKLSQESLVQELWVKRDSLIHTLFGLILKDNNARKATSKASKEMLTKLAKEALGNPTDENKASEESSNLAKAKGKLNTLMAHPEMAYGLLLPIAHVRTHLLMVGYYADQANPEYPYGEVKVSENNPPNLWLIPVEYAERGILSQSPVEFIFDCAPQAFRKGPIPGTPMRQSIKKVNLHAVPDGKYMFTFNTLRSWEIKSPEFSKAMCSVGFNDVFREHTFFYATKNDPSSTSTNDKSLTSKVKVVFMPSFTELLGISFYLTMEEVKLAHKPDWSMSFFDSTITQFFTQLSASLNALGKMYLPTYDEIRFFQENKNRLIQKLHTQAPNSAAKRLHDLWEGELKDLGTGLQRIMPSPTAKQLESLSLTWPFCLTVDAVCSLHTGLLCIEPDEDDVDSQKPYPEFLLESTHYSVDMDKVWTLAKSSDGIEGTDSIIQDEPFVLSLSLSEEQEAMGLAQQVEEVNGLPQPVAELKVAKAQELASFCTYNAIAIHRLLSASLMDISPPKSMPERELDDAFWMY